MLYRVRELRDRARQSVGAVATVFRNPNLRRLQFAWAGSTIGQWAYGVALSVFAFRAGGAGTLGLVWLIRMVPSALVAPFAGVLGDRYRREWVMISSDLVRAALIGAGAAVIGLGASPAVVYALAALVSVAGTPFRAAEAALVPSLARTPEELTAANVTGSSIESVGFFLGPALAGVLLSVTGPTAVFAATAAAFLWSAFFVSLVKTGRRERAEGASAEGILVEVLAGFRAIGSSGVLRVLFGLLIASWLVVGLFEVLLVATALDLLHIGKSGVGFLNSAYGVGALVGTLASMTLVGARRLSPAFVAGVVAFGAALGLVGAAPHEAAALILFGVAGAGSTLFSIAGFTLVQRLVVDEVMARVFGVIQLGWLGTVGIGAVLAAPLIHGLGVKHALIATGAALPVVVLLLGPRLIRLDSAAAPPSAELSLLRAVPIFAPLPGTALEHLAGRLVPLRFEPGAEIVREGDRGDRFYLVVDGEVEVLVDGRPTAQLGPGEHFGEIALLRNVPRTATVVARTPVTVYALEREDFLAAVSSHPPSARAADAVVGSRLDRGAALPRPVSFGPAGEASS
jgi:MFS family permease